jgi:hypothetical protein
LTGGGNGTKKWNKEDLCMSHSIRQCIYVIKPNLNYISLLQNKLKNYKFYCIKVKLGTQHTSEFYNLNDIKIISPFLHERQRIKCQISFIKDCGDFFRAKTFDLDFELNIYFKCLKCGLTFNSEEEFEKHKIIHLKYY